MTFDILMVVHLGSVWVKVKGHSGKPQTDMQPCRFPLGFLPTEHLSTQLKTPETEI